MDGAGGGQGVGSGNVGVGVGVVGIDNGGGGGSKGGGGTSGDGTGMVDVAGVAGQDTGGVVQGQVGVGGTVVEAVGVGVDGVGLSGDGGNSAGKDDLDSRNIEIYQYSHNLNFPHFPLCNSVSLVAQSFITLISLICRKLSC